MKQKQLIMILLIVIFLTIGITLLAYSYYQVLDKVVYDADVTIISSEDKMGFIIDTDGIRFGKVPIYGVPKRNIILTNTWDEEIEIMIEKHGEIKDWMQPSEYNFIMQPNETKNVEITLYPSPDAKLGLHTGRISVVFLRV